MTNLPPPISRARPLRADVTPFELRLEALLWAFHNAKSAKAAGIRTKIDCHTFRATGITIYLTNGGDLEKAQQMAGA